MLSASSKIFIFFFVICIFLSESALPRFPASDFIIPIDSANIKFEDQTERQTDVKGKKNQGTDYYISNTGNDSLAGTSPQEAWRTIARANAIDFESGDRILFAGGQIFSGEIVFTSEDSGTFNQPVTVTSYGSGRATINSGGSKAINAHNCAGIVITNLNFVGSGREDSAGDSGIYFYTDDATGRKLDFIRIDSIEVSGYHKAGIEIGAWHASNSGFRDVRITKATAHNNGDKGIVVWGYFASTHNGWSHEDIYIGHCKAFDNPGIPKKKGHTGNGIIVSGVNGAVIEYCEAYNNGALNSGSEGGPIGIWAWDANNVIIQYCESHHNKTNNNKDGGGFDLDGGVTNSVMQYNYSHDNAGAGYGIYQFNGAREFKNNTVRYNISENDGLVGGYGAIHFWATNSNGGIQNTKVYHNTLYVSENTTGAGIADINVGATYIYNSEIYNNIIVTAAGKRAVDIPHSSGSWDFMGNCYWSYGSNVEIKWDSKIYSGLNGWRSVTGQEKIDDIAVGMETDPKLTDPGNGATIGDPEKLTTLSAYRMQPASPVIDKGIDLKSRFGIEVGSHDFFGTSLPQFKGFDIGACEATTVSSIHEDQGNVPVRLKLEQNFPNPFNPQTEICYTLARESNIELSVHNLLGHRVITLVREYKPAGRHSAIFNGRSLSSGVYFYKIEAKDQVLTKKMMLIR